MSVTLKVILGDKAKKDGTFPVQLRVTVNRQNRKPGLGIFVKEKDFNPEGGYDKKNWIRTRNEDHDHYNKQIRTIYKKVRKRILKAQLAEVPLTPDLVRDMVADVVAGKGEGKESVISFTEFYRQVMEGYLPGQLSTYDIYLRVFDLLHQWKPAPILFSDLDSSFAVSFFKFLSSFKIRGKKNLKTSSANTYMAKVKHVTEQAKRTVVMVNGKKTALLRQEDDPFLNYEAPAPLETHVDILTPEEMALIESAELTGDMFHARNVFITQYYLAGSRVSDILLLKWDKVAEGRISYNSRKTGFLHSLKSHSKLEKVLQHYQGTGYIFPYLTEDLEPAYKEKRFLKNEIARHLVRINDNLKALVKSLGIKKNIHSHVSRHSFTSASLLAGTPLYDVSKAIGHNSFSTTENYTKRIKRTSADRAVDSVFKNDVAE